MTLTVNVHNCSVWAATHAYTLGARVSNDTAPVKAYQCITPGTSAGSGGPTGTGSSISDGSVVWKYLSAIDYTSPGAAITGVGTLSQPTVIQLWNDAEYVQSSITVSGNTTTSSNTLLITTAPGEGFADNANAQTNALKYNQANGVGVRSNSGTALIVSEDYVTVKGLQISCVSGSSAVQLLSGYSHSIIDSCILWYSLTTGTLYTAFINDGLVRNCLIYTASATGLGIGGNGNSFKSACNTVVAASDASNSGTGTQSNYSTITTTDCAVFGFSTAFGVHATAGTNNASDKTISFGSGNKASVTYANQFVGTTRAAPDFREKAGADCIGAGSTDTTDVPSALDIVGTARPAGLWDIGAWQLASSGTNLAPGAGSIVVTGFTATLASGLSLGPGAGSAVLTGAAPTIAAGTSLAAGAGSIVLTGAAASLTAGATLLPGAGSVILSGQIPALTSGTFLAPGFGSVVITGNVPILTLNTTLLPGVGGIVITGFAAGIGGTLSLNPGAGSVVLTGAAPTITSGLSLNPGVGSVAFSGFSPAVVSGLSVFPGVGATIFNGFPASVALGINVNLLPPSGMMVLSGFAPLLGSGSPVPSRFAAIPWDVRQGYLAADVRIGVLSIDQQSGKLSVDQ